MQATYVPPVKTPLTFEKAHQCMRWALKTHIGAEPTDEVVALALAKTALETGRWKAIYNSNWGNVKATDQYVGMYTCFKCNEILTRAGKQKVIWFAPEGELSSKDGMVVGQRWPVPPGHIQSRFRAYANAYDGADQYVSFVANGRYKLAWQALLQGSVTGYVHELKVKGYFTAHESEYLRGVEGLYREMLKRVQGVPDPDLAKVEWDRLKDLIPRIQFSLDELLRETPPEPNA